MNACRSLGEVEGGLNVGSAVSGQDVLAGCLEGVRNGCGSTREQVAYGASNLDLTLVLHLSEVLLLEGLAIDLGKGLCSCGGIGTENEAWHLSEHLAKEFNLHNSFLDIVGDGQKTQPVGNQVGGILRVALYEGILVLNDLTNASNSVITSVMVHSHLLLLALDLWGDSELDAALERGEAKLGASLEVLTCVLCNDTDTVGGGLSESGAVMAGETADGLNHLLEVFGREVRGSEMLNHIVKDEQGELEALLLLAGEASGNDFIAKCEYKLCNKVSMGLHKDAHEFGSANLKVELVGVLLFNKGEVIGIKCVILILDLFGGECIVFSDSLEGLVDNTNCFNAKIIDLF